MEAKTYFVTAALAACVTVPAFAAEPSAHQKKLAALAADDGAFKRAQSLQDRDTRLVSGAGRERIDAFTKLCKIKPVMTDPEIEGCKKAYKM